MIRKIYADNYKCLVNFEVDIGDLTLLAGENGVGKSAILDVIFAMHRLLASEVRVIDADVFSTSSLTRWESRKVQTFGMDVMLDDEIFIYRLDIEHQPEQRTAHVLAENLLSGGRPLFIFDSGKFQLFNDDHSEGSFGFADRTGSALGRIPAQDSNRRLTRFLDFVRRIVVCRLSPQDFRPDALTEDTHLKRDGSNFVAWFRHVAQEDLDAIDAYKQDLQECISGFKGVRLERVGRDSRVFLTTWDTGSQFELHLDELSDGHRCMLVLYAFIYLTKRQKYALFLDEPDNFLAPIEVRSWLMKLEDALDEALSQIVVCSHHPNTLDFLGPMGGILLSRTGSGVTIAQELREALPDLGISPSDIMARGWVP